MRRTDPDTEEELSETDRKVSSNAGALAVKSINEHWSVGVVSIFHIPLGLYIIMLLTPGLHEAVEAR
jgi:hypothetical protein